MNEEQEKKTVEKEKENTETKTDADAPEESGAKKTIETLDRAEEINNVKSRNLKREEDLQTRKEEFAARKMVGGETEGGQEPVKPKEETPKEYNDRIEKELSEGKHND